MNFKHSKDPVFLQGSKALMAAAVAMAFASPASAAGGGQFEGQVVGVTDGDTITVLTEGNRQREVRLWGIDAPETSCHARKPSAQDDACVEGGQAFGRAAKKNLANMVYNERVTVVVRDVDKYGRTVGAVFLGDMSVNLAQVRSGFAWVSPIAMRGETRDVREIFEGAEKEAKAQRTGLWNDKEPMAPWTYRELLTKNQAASVGGLGNAQVTGVNGKEIIPGQIGVKAGTLTVRDLLGKAGLPVPPRQVGIVRPGEEVRKGINGVLQKMRGDPPPAAAPAPAAANTPATSVTETTKAAESAPVAEGVKRLGAGVSGFFKKAADSMKEAAVAPRHDDIVEAMEPERRHARP